MAQGGQGQGQAHGGGQNNANKRGKHGRSAPAASGGPPATFRAAVRTPGGAHIVGFVPAPVEVTKRPGRR